MDRARKLAVLVLATAAAAVAGAGLIAGGLVGAVVFANRCTNDPLVEYPAPGGTMRLVVFQRACGVNTMAIGTQASLLSPGQALPAGEGNAFRADTNHFAAPLGPGGGPIVRVTWEGPTRVLIQHDRRARVFLPGAQIAGITAHSAPF